MTITRSQVADLQPGDVVELTSEQLPPGTVIRGPLHGANGSLLLGWDVVRMHDGEPYQGSRRTLTVVSRAPRPLYVNHPRTEPVAGDVVRDGNGEVRYGMPTKTVNDPTQYGREEIRWWASVAEYDGEWLHCSTGYMASPLTLLVDGETGQVVQ